MSVVRTEISQGIRQRHGARARNWLFLAAQQIRRMLLAAGRRTGQSQLIALRTGLGALEQGHLCRHRAWNAPNLADRFAVFEQALARITGALCFISTICSTVTTNCAPLTNG